MTSSLTQPRLQHTLIVTVSASGSASYARASHSSTTAPTSSNSFSPYPLLVGNTVTSTPESNDDEHDVVVKLNELTLLSSKLKQAHVGNYYGKSSNKALMMNAFALFKELDATASAENTVNELDMMRSEFWESQPVR